MERAISDASDGDTDAMAGTRSLARAILNFGGAIGSEPSPRQQSPGSAAQLI